MYWDLPFIESLYLLVRLIGVLNTFVNGQF